MLSQYTSRALTQGTDPLDAISGMSTRSLFYSYHDISTVAIEGGHLDTGVGKGLLWTATGN